MRCWASPEEVGKRMPAHSMALTKVSCICSIPKNTLTTYTIYLSTMSCVHEIDVKIVYVDFQSMVVEPAPRLSMRRPNALLLRDGKTEFFLAFESKEERTLWMDTISQVYY